MTRATSIRVLVADDSAEMRSALTAVIEADVELELAAIAADAGEAVELAAREQPDVAVVDARMPAGGGAVAVRGIALRSPRTSVILLSASGVAPNGLETEITDYIAKGGPISTLVDSVKRCAEGRSSRPSP